MQAAERVLYGLPVRSPIRFGRGGFCGPVQVSFVQATAMQASRCQRGFMQTYHYAGAVMTMYESGLYAGYILVVSVRASRMTVFSDGFIWKRKLDEVYKFLT